jgi:hypothetical protein
LTWRGTGPIDYRPSPLTGPLVACPGAQSRAPRPTIPIRPDHLVMGTATVRCPRAAAPIQIESSVTKLGDPSWARGSAGGAGFGGAPVTGRMVQAAGCWSGPALGGEPSPGGVRVTWQPSRARACWWWRMRCSRLRRSRCSVSCRRPARTRLRHPPVRLDALHTLARTPRTVSGCDLVKAATRLIPPGPAPAPAPPESAATAAHPDAISSWRAPG